jgi:hypothetical protein
MDEPTCSEGGCDEQPIARGKCSRHYEKMRRESKRTGIPLPPLVRRRSRNGLTNEDRFHAKVSKDGPIPAHRPGLGACWIWTGGTGNSGYGAFFLHGKQIGAHRAAYELFVDPIPDGLEPDHLCHPSDGSCLKNTKCPHRLCVNPAHLELVTHRENVRRGTSLFAANMAATHCPQGHEYTPENTRVRVGRGGNENRSCKECDRLRRPEPTGKISPLIAANIAKTHCPYGHEYTPENTFIDRGVGGKNGGRRCKICRREQQKRRNEAKRRNAAQEHDYDQ